MNTKFRTSDGYTLYLVDGVWVDNLEADNVDMTFEADSDGYPVEADTNERLEGSFVE